MTEGERLWVCGERAYVKHLSFDQFCCEPKTPWIVTYQAPPSMGMYVKLVEALCAEHQINLIKVSYSLDFVFLKEKLAYCKLGQLQTCVHLKAMHNDFCHTRESL